MVIYTDHLLRLVKITPYPKRIISLCPSVTETLFSLGLMHRISGRTRFCIHPKDRVGIVPRIGGTKSIHYDKIKSLSPDLILAVKEENTLEMVDNLSETYSVFVLDIKKLEEGWQMINTIGKLTQSLDIANELSGRIEQSWEPLKGMVSGTTCLYMIWDNPMMVVGSETYINSLLEHCGFVNLANQLHGRYPEINAGVLSDLSPQFLLLSSEPFPFKQKHLKTFHDLLPNSNIILVDGEMFSWYGSRMMQASNHIREILELIRKEY